MIVVRARIEGQGEFINLSGRQLLELLTRTEGFTFHGPITKPGDVIVLECVGIIGVGIYTTITEKITVPR